MIREIVKDIAFLQQKSSPAVKADIPAITDLLDTVKAHSDTCVGMAANMIGIRKTILVALIGSEYVVMINPTITDRSKACYEVEEGCLSLDGTRMTKRYESITVEYQDRKFKKRNHTFSSRDAQIIQHEIDHFSGIII